MRGLTTLILVAVMAVGLSGCGRRGNPVPPEGSTYPRHYPEVPFPQQPGTERSGSEMQSQ